MKRVEQIPSQIGKGHIRAIRQDNGQVIWEAENVITNTTKWLFARLAANIIPGDAAPPYTQGHEVLYGIWGLALGTGSPSWAPETQPVETPTQTALITEVKRKPLSQVQYVDSNFNPLPGFSLQVDFQTVVNATTDGLTGVGIREMGLISGGTVLGSTPTNMLTAPYFNPADTSLDGGPNVNSVVLVNYKTLPPLILPSGVNIIFSWILSF